MHPKTPLFTFNPRSGHAIWTWGLRGCTHRIHRNVNAMFYNFAVPGESVLYMSECLRVMERE